MQVTIEVNVSTGYVGCSKSEIIEIDMEDTDDQIIIGEQCESVAQEWLWENINFGYNIKSITKD